MKNALSSLRFIFSILVFVGHLGLTKVAVGHAFFIILSGYIMTYVYEKRLLLNTLSKKDFFLKRLIRIYPLHLITLLISLFFVTNELLQNFWFFISKLAVNFFLIQTIVPYKEVYFGFNGVSWNVSVLLFCYLLFPFLISFLSRISLKFFSYLIVIFIILLILLMIFIPQKCHHAIFYISPVTRIFDFIFGIYLFKISQVYNVKSKIYSLLEVISILLFLIFFIAANLFSEQFLPFAYSIYFWIPLGFLVFVFNLEKGFVSNRILKKPIFIFLGTLSFPFYLWHHLVIPYFEQFDYGFSESTLFIFMFLVCFVITLIISYSYNYFENKYISGFLKKYLISS